MGSVSSVSLGLVADSLGYLVAEKRELSDKEAAFKAELIEGAGDYVAVPKRFKGAMFEVLVSSSNKKVVDKDAVIEYLAKVLCLGPVELGSILAEHSKFAVVPVVKVSAIKAAV